MMTNYTFTKASNFYFNIGTNKGRVGIYRGTLSTGVLQGESNATVPTGYTVRTLGVTGTITSNLSFLSGEQVSVAFTTSGKSGSKIVGTTGPSNISLAIFTTNTFITTSFPVLITGITGTTGTQDRVCMDLS
jgi:hypothetical protein